MMLFFVIKVLKIITKKVKNPKFYRSNLSRKNL